MISIRIAHRAMRGRLAHGGTGVNHSVCDTNLRRSAAFAVLLTTFPFLQRRFVPKSDESNKPRPVSGTVWLAHG